MNDRGSRLMVLSTRKASSPVLVADSFFAQQFRWGVAALGVAAGLMIGPNVGAQDALSNLGQPLYGGNYAAGGYVNGFKFGDAVEFTTGSTPVYFTGATFPFFKDPSYAPATGVEVSLHSGFGSAGSTGLIAALNGPSAPAISTTAALYSYTATTPVLLASDTRYWLQVDAFTTSASTYILWSATTNVGGIDPGGLAGWSYFDPGTFDVSNYFTNTGGVSWTMNTNPTSAPMFSVQYAAIPESNAAAEVVGLAAIVAAACFRRPSKLGPNPHQSGTS